MYVVGKCEGIRDVYEVYIDKVVQAFSPRRASLLKSLNDFKERIDGDRICNPNLLDKESIRLLMEPRIPEAYEFNLKNDLFIQYLKRNNNPVNSVEYAKMCKKVFKQVKVSETLNNKINERIKNQVLDVKRIKFGALTCLEKLKRKFNIKSLSPRRHIPEKKCRRLNKKKT